MSEQIQNYLILSLAASINFSMFAVVTVYLGSQNGRKKAIYMLAGSEIVLLVLGVLILYLSPQFLDYNIRDRFSHQFDWVIALILIALGIINLLREEKPKDESSVDNNFRKCFGVGFGMMLVNN